MVDEVVLRALDKALQEAANKRNVMQSEVSKLRSRVTDAKANLQRAETEESNTVERLRLKSEESRKLLDYYKGQVDKTGLEAIMTQIDWLTAETNVLELEVRKARGIRMRSNREHEEAKNVLAIAESNLTRARDEWLQVAEHARKAREET